MEMTEAQRLTATRALRSAMYALAAWGGVIGTGSLLATVPLSVFAVCAVLVAGFALLAVVLRVAAARGRGQSIRAGGREWALVSAAIATNFTVVTSVPMYLALALAAVSILVVRTVIGFAPVLA